MTLVPVWVWWLVGTAVAVVVLNVAWARVFRPVVRYVRDADRMITLLEQRTHDPVVAQKAANRVARDL